MNEKFPERDWKQFRKRLPGWQEAYMERLVKEYTDLLTSEGKASEKFWKLDKWINRDKRKSGVVVYNIRRSTMIQELVRLMQCDAITAEDLEGFTDETRERVLMIASHS